MRWWVLIWQSYLVLSIILVFPNPILLVTFIPVGVLREVVHTGTNTSGNQGAILWMHKPQHRQQLYWLGLSGPWACFSFPLGQACLWERWLHLQSVPGSACCVLRGLGKEQKTGLDFARTFVYVIFWTVPHRSMHFGGSGLPTLSLGQGAQERPSVG
jgi:hypothetical protein